MCRYLLSLLFLLTISISYGQENGSVWGHVSDAQLDNEPLLFAEVTLKDSPRSVQTNFHGNFELNDIKPGNHTIVIRYLGYEPAEIEVVVAENQVTRMDYSMGQLTYSDSNAEVAKSDSAPTSYLSSSGQN